MGHTVLIAILMVGRATRFIPSWHLTQRFAAGPHSEYGGTSGASKNCWGGGFTREVRVLLADLSAGAHIDPGSSLTEVRKSMLRPI
jgi:hypothetical protein